MIFHNVNFEWKSLFSYLNITWKPGDDFAGRRRTIRDSSGEEKGKREESQQTRNFRDKTESTKNSLRNFLKQKLAARNPKKIDI